MTDTVDPAPGPAVAAAVGGLHRSDRARARLARRRRAERRFRIFGFGAVTLALSLLLILIGTIVARGYPAFVQTEVTLSVTIAAADIPGDPTDPEALAQANYRALAADALFAVFPDVEGREDRRALRALLSPGAGYELRDRMLADPGLVGRTVDLRLPVAGSFDQLHKGHIDRSVPESRRRVTDRQIAWFDALVAEGRISTPFNTRLFANADSRYPELAGLWGALKGSFLTILVTLAISFPIGVAAAVYLEEFAPKNRWTDLIEVNINNLAAVPSIVFGLLGLAVFLQLFGLPRSAPLVGGMVLALMTLPTIIIASRASLQAVPRSIREGALGVGASPLQTVAHHVLPLALPGMLTGTIIGTAQALGETAPLLMIGMNAFMVDAPSGVTDPATVLPLQVYIWADSPERGFVERTSAAIMVLLGFLMAMNAAAVILRRALERRW
ncbi:MAG: phosphate ABC transporter permease PstA [Azospirillaceae bacterium]